MLTDSCEGDNEVMAPGVRPAFSDPALRHGRFEVWVLLRRECAESIRAGKSLYFPRKPNICPQLSPILSLLLITLQRRGGPYMSQLFTGGVFRYAFPLIERWRGGGMINFKGSQFEREIILWGVRWYVAYPISGGVTFWYL